MKKNILLLTFFCGFSFLAHTQLQRLAVLPSAMGSGDALASICIDFFRDGPSDINYSEIGNAGNTFHVEDLHTVRSTTSTPINETRFAGEKQEAIPEYYKKFLKAKIAEYDQGRSISEDELSELQL